MMARGRKLKQDRRRTTSGRISRSVEARDEHREAEERDAQKVVVLRRYREEMRNRVTHPFYGYPLGQLALIEYITPDEFNAGRVWAELTHRHAQVIGLMLPKCRAFDFDKVLGRSLAGDIDEEQIERLKNRKLDADNRIRRVGFGALREMMRVVVCDEEPTDRLLLRRALQALLDK